MGFFRRNRFPFLATLFLLVGLVLYSLSTGRGADRPWLGRMVLEVFGPVQALVTNAGDMVEQLWDRYFALVHAARKNEELTGEVALMRRQLTELEELRQGNRRLRALLDLRADTAYPTVAAEVVAVDPTKHFRTAMINKGTADGVERFMPVVQPNGVVGRIIWASPHFAKVLYLSDPNAAVDVFVQRSRTRGVVEGAGKDRLRLKYVLHNAEVEPGDALVTSGAAGVFPKGILVGRVLTVKKQGRGVFLSIEVEPAVDFERLEEVLVILQKPAFLKEAKQ